MLEHFLAGKRLRQQDALVPQALWLATGAIALIAVVLLASGQFEQAGRLWPYLFVLACPLMHLFMCRDRKQDTRSAPSAHGGNEDR